MGIAATAAGFEDVEGISIQLTGEVRPDGSVFITSPDLPIFSAVGDNEQDALDNAMDLLGPYLIANVPDFVDLKRITGNGVLGKTQESILPAQLIATTGGRDGRAAG